MTKKRKQLRRKAQKIESFFSYRQKSEFECQVDEQDLKIKLIRQVRLKQFKPEGIHF